MKISVGKPLDYRPNTEMKFYHSDEFESVCANEKFQYPIVLLKTENQLSEFISKEELNTIENLETFIEEILKRLRATP